jgi:hypothetical protein
LHAGSVRSEMYLIPLLIQYVAPSRFVEQVKPNI